MDEQTLLLQIVKTWNLNEAPEYRDFRCANCQEYKNEAWYHWLNSGNYKLPVHMCNDTCEPAFQNGSINVDPAKKTHVNRELFGKSHSYPENTVKRFQQIVDSWPDYKAPELKTFTCDECGKDLDIDSQDGERKGYHAWWKMPDGKTLVELHFHKTCGEKLPLW